MKTLKKSSFYLFLSAIILFSGFTIHVRSQSISFMTTQPIYEYSSCANDGIGENLIGEVSVHIVLFFNKDGIITNFIANAVGDEIYGQDTNNSYHTTGVTLEIVPNPSDSAFPYTFVNRYHFVGERGDQFIQYETFHITYNANGDLTAVVDNERTECD